MLKIKVKNSVGVVLRGGVCTLLSTVPTRNQFWILFYKLKKNNFKSKMSSDDEIESFLKKQQNIPIVFITVILFFFLKYWNKTEFRAEELKCRWKRTLSALSTIFRWELVEQRVQSNLKWKSTKKELNFLQIFPASRLRGDLHAPRGVPEAVLQAFSEYFQFAEARWGECCVWSAESRANSAGQVQVRGENSVHSVQDLRSVYVTSRANLHSSKSSGIPCNGLFGRCGFRFCRHRAANSQNRQQHRAEPGAQRCSESYSKSCHLLHPECVYRLV